MSSPYINTKLKTSILLHPYQMDNKVYINLKSNLERKIVGKCYSKYGFVVKVIEILNYKEGVIEAENTDSSALFELEFSTRICLPLKDTQIICKVDRVNKLLITAVNGPIVVIITNDRINDKVFFKDNNNNVRYKIDNKSDILKSNDMIKVTLRTIQFYDSDEKIKAIGFLDDIADVGEKKMFFDDEYKDSSFVDYNNYITKTDRNDNEGSEDEETQEASIENENDEGNNKI